MKIQVNTYKNSLLSWIYLIISHHFLHHFSHWMFVTVIGVHQCYNIKASKSCWFKPTYHVIGKSNLNWTKTTIYFCLKYCQQLIILTGIYFHLFLDSLFQLYSGHQSMAVIRHQRSEIKDKFLMRSELVFIFPIRTETEKNMLLRKFMEGLVYKLNLIIYKLVQFCILVV